MGAPLERSLHDGHSYIQGVFEANGADVVLAALGGTLYHIIMIQNTHLL